MRRWGLAENPQLRFDKSNFVETLDPRSEFTTSGGNPFALSLSKDRGHSFS